MVSADLQHAEGANGFSQAGDSEKPYCIVMDGTCCPGNTVTMGDLAIGHITLHVMKAEDTVVAIDLRCVVG
jgi:hypothetical protein